MVKDSGIRLLYLNHSSMNSSTLPGDHDEEKQAKGLKGRKYVLNELVQTEKIYVKDLRAVVEGYMKKMEEKGIPDDMKGKDKIIFGNLQQIYDWHNNYFAGQLDECLQEPEHLAKLFIKHEVKLDLGETFSLSDYLIKPVQRITKYQLLLKDFLKYSEQAGLECSEIAKAVDVMYQVPKRCNDMMNLGRLEGFKGKLTAQGKLLQQDTFLVTEQVSGVLSRSKERHVFLFEQILIFSERLKKGSSRPMYQFKNSIKVNALNIEDKVDNESCKFALRSHGTSERYILQAPNTEIWQAWVCDINKALEMQRNFLNALQSPIDYQKKELGPQFFRSRTETRRLSQPALGPDTANEMTGCNE
ncbi:kalirin-like isoform X3 [Stegostoma tigrinum]|uniref:kalirin-like isoform X3 n=1 Tax=Stegostoma tigrinum TaxID=3053191 RepID=UPI00202AFAB2|nr:kalirin-like isoform X3 [Stegostoma tigrinum]